MNDQSLDKTDVLKTVKVRFDKNNHRHEGLEWEEIEERLRSDESKLKSLHGMENTGGEPDVIGYDEHRDEYIFADCSKESPKERRRVCYDREALESRKKYKPETSARDMADELGVAIMTEEEYFHLQSLGEFDTKTSSWVSTPEKIRTLGGALFCDRRYDTVFVYHNGAESYYAGRGFRTILRV